MLRTNGSDDLAVRSILGSISPMECVGRSIHLPPSNMARSAYPITLGGLTLTDPVTGASCEGLAQRR